jgi:hydrogenase nickel incorporation protein HypA/HybF
MHELALAQAIIETAEQQAAANGAKRVLRLSVRVGELTAVMPDALRFCFEIAAAGSILDGATLELTTTRWRVRCSGCAETYDVQQSQPCCPACGVAGGETTAGRELQLTEMEIE